MLIALSRFWQANKAFHTEFGMVGPVGLPSCRQALLAQRHRPSKLRYHPSENRHHQSEHRHRPRRYKAGGKNHVEYSSSPESQRSWMCSFTTNLAEIEDALQMQTWFTECFTIDHRSPYLTMMNPSDCCFDLFCRLLGEMVWVDRSALSSFATACYRGESLTEIGCSSLRMWKRL